MILQAHLILKKNECIYKAPAPTTDKFVCVTAGAPYHDPIHSDDYEQRRHCEIMEHVNDVVRTTCDGKPLSNVLDVGKDETE